MVECLTPEEAIGHTVKRFPFNGYMTKSMGGFGAYQNIAKTVLQYLNRGCTILDVGCGPCDKTAILQFLGYRCYGYDDLQDDWHNLPGSKDKIMSFARECGIDFRLAHNDILPFEKNSFDMIMLNDILEHLHNSPRDLLNDLLELAKTEALLFVTVPNIVNIRKRIDILFGKTNLGSYETYYWYPGSWRGHVREYAKKDLIKLSKYLGLDVLELHGCDHMLQRLPPSMRSLYLLVTKIFDGLKDTWILVARKRKNWKPRKKLPPGEFAVIIGEVTSYQYSE